MTLSVEHIMKDFISNSSPVLIGGGSKTFGATLYLIDGAPLKITCGLSGSADLRIGSLVRICQCLPISFFYTQMLH